MANGHGGYRQPARPAATSGPGSLSQRTDGGPGAKAAAVKLPDAGYGEQKDFQAIQQGAPITKAGGGTSGGNNPTPAPPPPTLDAPSGRPGEPVTHGADAGAGLGQDSLGLFDSGQMAANDNAYLMKYLPTLQYMVDTTPNPPLQTLALVRYLRSQV
jgi:hypothetical protein